MSKARLTLYRSFVPDFEIVSTQIVSKNRKVREKSKVPRRHYKIIELGPRKKWRTCVAQIRPTDESWNHFHSFLNANTINLCGLHANIFLRNLMLTICSNVWRANTVLPFLTTFLAILQNNVKNRRKNPRNFVLSSVLVNFCRRKKSVDISSTKPAFFVLWGREVLLETSRFLFDFRR
jgi:hypothetical protein